MTERRDTPFEIQSVVHLVCPTGDSARHLEELRDAIARASDRSLFWHIAGGQRREPWCAELAPDDFSAWVGTVVQDRVTAERLSYAVQSRRGASEPLRAALLETLESVGERQRRARAAPEGGEFPMLTFESVAVPTGLEAHDPESLEAALAVADAGAWFHHAVEQPWLGAEGPLLGDWLRARGATRLAEWFADLASSGLPLETMRRKLLERRRRAAIRRRISEAAASVDGERQQATRAAVEALVRRIRRARGAT
jgi:uncharacterized protein DUF5752